MDADENAVRLRIRHGGSILELHESVIIARHEDLDARLLQFVADPAGDVEGEVFLKLVRTGGPLS